MKAKFKKFLTDNRIYRKFVRNLKDQKNMSFDEYCGINGIWDEAIIDAFTWGSPRDSFDYWSTFNKKWEKLLENEQNTS